MLFDYLLENPTGEKNTPIFLPDILGKKFDFGLDNNIVTIHT
jgi:hypothetical protein